jgi:hypothetical protein
MRRCLGLRAACDSTMRDLNSEHVHQSGVETPTYRTVVGNEHVRDFGWSQDTEVGYALWWKEMSMCATSTPNTGTKAGLNNTDKAGLKNKEKRG